MFSFKLGLKNLTRQKRRNVITIMVIAFAFFGYLFMDSVMGGMEEMSFSNIKNYDTGNIQVVHPEYWEDREKLPLENLIYINQDTLDNIKNTNGLLGVSPELRFKANLNNGIDEAAVLGLGISPEQYKKVFATQNYIFEGSMFAPGESKAVIGVKLAELMDLKINDYITLLIRTKEDTFNTIDVEIAGLFEAPNPITNNGVVFVPLDIAQQALNVGNGVSLLALKTASGDEDKIIKALTDGFKNKDLDLKAYSWREPAESIIALSTAKKGGAATILSVVLLIGMIGIINNVILSALERTGEIGMMKALGMREWEIVFVFMVEATGIGILGGLAGCLIGFAGVGLMAKYGFDLSYMGGDMSEYGIPILDKIYGTWNYPAFSFLFILSVIVALLSSIVPAYWAAHKDPVKAIYHR
ncbi:FtsX-like permease family protein [bacterium]|nr:FtsX-like permease family protein [bacterium]MBU4601555.1 FtsX-like permease family protein [bacterium]